MHITSSCQGNIFFGIRLRGWVPWGSRVVGGPDDGSVVIECEGMECFGFFLEFGISWKLMGFGEIIYVNSAILFS